MASAAAAGVGAAVRDTGGVKDGVAAAIVALGLVAWAGVWAATCAAAAETGRGGTGGGETRAGGVAGDELTVPSSLGATGPGAFSPRASWPGAAAILTATVLVRLPWLFAPPVFSDDLYRYVWEGRVWAAGFNPFASAPIDPVLSLLRDAVWAKVNHPEVSSIYPPLAQLLFVLLAPGGVLAWKLLGTLADCGTVALLARRSARSGWLWALLPLTGLESAGSGHLESVGVFLLVLALSEEAGGRTRSAMAAAWAGAMVKLLPGAVLLPLVRGWRARLGVGLATVIAMAPILAAGQGAFRGFETYRAVWAFNGSVYPLLAWLFGDAGGDPARKLLQGVGAAWVGIMVWRSRGRADAPAAVALAATGAFVLLSPTVHPWYVLWPLAVGLWWADQPATTRMPGTAAALAPTVGRSSLPWTLAAVLVPLAYRVLGTLQAGVWHEQAVTRWVIWVPVWTALLVVSWRGRGPMTRRS